jgi:hypothetical protein
MIRQGRETAEERCQKKSRLCFQAQAAFAYENCVLNTGIMNSAVWM